MTIYRLEIYGGEPVTNDFVDDQKNKSVTVISESMRIAFMRCFRSCIAQKSVVLGKSVDYIGSSPFTNCEKLE